MYIVAMPKNAQKKNENPSQQLLVQVTGCSFSRLLSSVNGGKDRVLPPPQKMQIDICNMHSAFHSLN